MTWTPITRRCVAMVGVLGLPGTILFAITHKPFMATFGPKCILYETTKLYCPGCGGTRAVYALAQGDLVKAFHCNLLIPVTLSLLVWLWWSWLRLAITGNWKPMTIRNAKIAIGLAILLILFAFLRNLPWYPFTLLAPY